MTQTVSSGDTLTLASGDTKTVERVLTVEGEVEVEGRLIVNNVHTLESVSNDADTSTGTLNRIRNLIAGESPLKISSGDTVTVDSQQREGGVVVEGRLVVNDVLEVTNTQPAKDADSTDIFLENFIPFVGNATDTDTSTATAKRTRDLASQSVDADSTTATLNRIRNLISDISDVDDAEAKILFSSAKTDPRQFAIDVMDNISNWPDGQAEIYRNEDVPHKSKENNADPAIYVHIPTGGDSERFSAEKVDLIETDTVRMNIWIAPNANKDGAALARDYRDKVVRIFQRYMNDNFEFTEFHDVQPTETTDFRHQKIARQTDHYIYQVEIETERIDTDT